jgi:hypothetical protein
MVDTYGRHFADVMVHGECGVENNTQSRVPTIITGLGSALDTVDILETGE